MDKSLVGLSIINSTFILFVSLYEYFKDFVDVKKLMQFNPSHDTNNWYHLIHDSLEFADNQQNSAYDKMSQKSAENLLSKLDDFSVDFTEQFGDNLINYAQKQSSKYSPITQENILHFIYILILSKIIHHYDEFMNNQEFVAKEFAQRYQDKKVIFEKLHQAILSQYQEFDRLIAPIEVLKILKYEIEFHSIEVGNSWKQMIIEKSQEFALNI